MTTAIFIEKDTKDMIKLSQVMNLICSLEENGTNVEGYVAIVRPSTRIDDTAKVMLRHKKIEIIRDQAAPIESMYLMDRKKYNEY